MFDKFAERISTVLDKIRRNGVLKESDVDAALREIRMALLEADVSLSVAKKFIEDVKTKAIGQDIIKSISPGQMVTKIVYDHLVDLLGSKDEIKISSKPYKIMLVGLQGAGKTTSAAKLAQYFSKQKQSVTLYSTDIYRPAAIKQLKILASQINGVIFDQTEDDINLSFDEISKKALDKFLSQKSDILILDTAGRLQIDDVKMDELIKTAEIIHPHEIFLVADIMTGQDAINIAQKFSETLNITGLILTRADADARGGVALSMRKVTGCKIKFLCTGEQLNDIEFFDPERIASRMLDMGDIVSLVEKAQENFSKEEALNTAQKLQEGIFTFDDLAQQMEKMSKLGGIKSIFKMLPQGKQLNNLLDQHGISDKTVTHNLAIIKSMTKKEKLNYKLLNGSRKKRIALGSGTSIQEVNKLIKQYESTLQFLKKIKKQGGLMNMLSSLIK